MSKTQKIFKNYSSPRQWFTVNSADDEIPEILIYDMIGTDFWGDGISPKDFVNEINKIEKTHSKLNLRINSPGGFIHDGFTIYNAIKQSSLKTTVYVDGLAASAAAFIAMAGDTILVPEASEIMIHNAWGYVLGGAGDMKKESVHLVGLDKTIANIFSDRTGIEYKEIVKMMKDETWMDGEKAVDLGFADALIEESKVAACAFELDSDLLPNLPENFIRIQTALKKREKENNLRDADSNISRSEAKKIVSDNLRDAEKKQRDAAIQNYAQEQIIKEMSKWMNR